MKRLSLSLFWVLFLLVEGLAQDTTKWVVKAGETIAEVIRPEVIYRYPQFVMGSAYVGERQIARVKMNYNRLLAEVQFIDARGDTLSVDNASSINLITIGEDSFYYKSVYMELLTHFGAIKLAVNERIHMAERQRMGAFDLPTNAASIESIGKYEAPDKQLSLVAREDLVFIREHSFFIGNKKNSFIAANRKNLLREFSQYRIRLQEYLEKNNVNFQKETDLRQLCMFLDSLTTAGNNTR